MEHKIYFDIETIPDQRPEAIENAMKFVTPPGSIKKPESIEKWMAENADAKAAEIVAKTSFDPAAGHICTIAWAIDDEEITLRHAETVDQESMVLQSFFDSMKEFARYQFIGHYITGFDLRFILCRSVVLGVRIPSCIPRDPKPWGNSTFDTMIAWAGVKGTISADNLSCALGVSGKIEFDGEKFDGSMVAQAWANGEHEKIAEYCRDDVRMVREIYKKFEAVGW